MDDQFDQIGERPSSFLAWLKSMLTRFDGMPIANLATSGISMSFGQKWLDDTLTKRGSEIASLLKVTSEYGLEQLKQRLRAAFGISAPHQVILTTGASRAITRFFETLLATTPNAEVLIWIPTYGPLLEIPKRLGAKVSWLQGSTIADGLNASLSASTKAVVLCNPNNPTGRFIPAEQQHEILQVIETLAPHSALLLDHTYAGFREPDELVLRNHPRVVSVNTLSKCFGARLNLLRAGWLSADPSMYPELFDDAILFDNSGCKVSEILTLFALERIDEFRTAALRHLEVNYEVVRPWLGEMEAAGIIEPIPFHGGPVVFPRVAQVTDTYPLVMEMADESQVLVAPGFYFEPHPSNAMRIGIGGDPDILRTGLKRISDALARRTTSSPLRRHVS